MVNAPSEGETLVIAATALWWLARMVKTWRNSIKASVEDERSGSGYRGYTAIQAPSDRHGMWRARRKANQNDGLAALDRIAQEVSTLLASGSTGAACESALNELVPAARDHVDRHRSMTATVPNTLWACGDSAVTASALDLAAPLRLRATRFAMFAEATLGQRELVLPSNEMLLGSLQAVVDLGNRLKPLEELSAERKLQMIDSMTWPYLRSSEELFKGAADLMSMLHRSHEQGLWLLAIALGGMALDLEAFIPPHDLDGRLAAQETRFRVGILLCVVEPVQYENADDHLRQGLTRIIELDQPGIVVDSSSLAPALNALKFLLFAAGHLSPLTALEMAFDGLEQIEQFTLEIPDDRLFQAALRSRVQLRGRVSGFGLRLANVLTTLDTNQPTRLKDLVDQAITDDTG